MYNSFMTDFLDIDAIVTHSMTQGCSFFYRKSMKFFSSRVSSRVHPGGVFVTSERRYGDERRYTVRRVLEDGSVVNVGKFQEHSSLKAAHAAAEYFSNGGVL